MFLAQMTNNYDFSNLSYCIGMAYFAFIHP